MNRIYSTSYAATCTPSEQINKIPNQIWEKIFKKLDEFSLVKAQQARVRKQSKFCNFIFKNIHNLIFKLLNRFARNGMTSSSAKIEKVIGFGNP